MWIFFRIFASRNEKSINNLKTNKEYGNQIFPVKRAFIKQSITYA